MLWLFKLPFTQNTRWAIEFYNWDNETDVSANPDLWTDYFFLVFDVTNFDLHMNFSLSAFYYALNYLLSHIIYQCMYLCNFVKPCAPLIVLKSIVSIFKSLSLLFAYFFFYLKTLKYGHFESYLIFYIILCSKFKKYLSPTIKLLLTFKRGLLSDPAKSDAQRRL